MFYFSFSKISQSNPASFFHGLGKYHQKLKVNPLLFYLNMMQNIPM